MNEANRIGGREGWEGGGGDSAVAVCEVLDIKLEGVLLQFVRCWAWSRGDNVVGCCRRIWWTGSLNEPVITFLCVKCLWMIFSGSVQSSSELIFFTYCSILCVKISVGLLNEVTDVLCVKVRGELNVSDFWMKWLVPWTMDCQNQWWTECVRFLNEVAGD